MLSSFIIVDHLSLKRLFVARYPVGMGGRAMGDCISVRVLVIAQCSCRRDLGPGKVRLLFVDGANPGKVVGSSRTGSGHAEKN